MRIVSIVSRYLLGLMFTVFGLNGFLHFIPQGPMPEGPAGQFAGALASTHYFHAIFAVQLVCGLLLLAGFFVPLALVVLASVLVNILLFHITMAPATIVPALIAVALWVLAAWGVWPAFEGLLQARTPTATRATTAGNRPSARANEHA